MGKLENSTEMPSFVQTVIVFSKASRIVGIPTIPGSSTKVQAQTDDETIKTVPRHRNAGPMETAYIPDHIS